MFATFRICFYLTIIYVQKLQKIFLYKKKLLTKIASRQDAF